MSEDTRNKTKPVRPTIQAIAKKAGVSRTTVSLILTNREDMVSRFRPETVERVREAASELGYRANLMAISLRSSSPSFFGLILRGAYGANAISWHHQAFEGQFLAGSLEACRSHKLYPVLATQDSPDPEGALQRVRGVLDGGVCGAIFRTPVPVMKDAIQRQIENGLPVISIFPEHPEQCPENCIDMDNIAAGRKAGELLANAGRTKWIMVCEDRLWDAIQLREQGFLAVAKEVGAQVEVLSVPADFDERKSNEYLMPRIRDIQPDGVYAASSVMGVGSLQACLAAGRRIPEETCVVGCDASLWRAPGCPAITSVDVSWYAAGELAVKKMAELRDSEESRFDSIKLLPTVRKGESCPGGEEEPASVIDHT